MDMPFITPMHSRYLRFLLVSFVLPTVVLALVGVFYFQPYWGPLTRKSGYLENNFGWTQPQEIFDKPLFRIAKSVAEYDKYYDVVVIGDSFSHDEKNIGRTI